MSADKRKALGRGLSALLPGSPAMASKREYFVAAIEEVHPSGQNPRRSFDEAGMQELVDSLREHGLLQPLVVRSRPELEGGGFTLIAGERRWRAAQKAGLKEVPVVVKEASAAEAFELALVENLQRRDLNPLEEAEAFRRLADDHGLTHEEIARRIGKDRSTIVNSVRLLKLPDLVRAMLVDGRLQMGHARCLLGLSAELIAATAESVVTQGLSVRQTEALVAKLKAPPRESPKTPPKSPLEQPQKSANLRDLEQRLHRSLGVPVRVAERVPGAGKLEIDYANLDELDRVLDKLLRP